MPGVARGEHPEPPFFTWLCSGQKGIAVFLLIKLVGNGSMETRAAILREQPQTLWLQRGQDALGGCLQLVAWGSCCPRAARASLRGFICLRGFNVNLSWIY